MNDEIFLGMFKDGPVDVNFEDIFSGEDSSPVSSSSDGSPASSPPFSSGDFCDDLLSSNTFFGDIEQFADTLAVPVQVKQESTKQVDSEISYTPPNVNLCTTEEPPKKRAKIVGKKRNRNQAIANSADPALLNDKEKLLTLSSKKLEEYVQSLSRPLTIDEEKQLKRQRRLIKNRESAQLSRQKKKAYVEDLEKKVQTLTAEAEALRTQVSQLSEANQSLDQQVTYLQNFIHEQGHQLPSQQLQVFNKNTAATAGLCMFVILFSFGLFFSAGTTPGTAVDFTAPRVYTGRTLAEFPVAIEGPKDVSQIAVKRFRDFNEEIPEPKRARIEEVDDVNAFWEDEEIESGYSFSVPSEKRTSTPSHQIIVRPHEETKPANSSFIYCSEAHQLTSPLEQMSTADGSPIINVLLPAAVLNGTIPYMNDLVSDPENALLEVSCQVLNITVFPYFPTVDHLAVPQPLLS